MTSALERRGPDGEGLWQDGEVNLGLGHRRLSILDLSEAGDQPMHSHCGRYVIVFNGEIYNHLRLRDQLENQYQPPRWNGHSDTETLLQCIAQWGLVKSLNACVGMFAFALWDRKMHTLSLARDRMGEKPLYYGWQNNVFLFGSELNALSVHPSFKKEVNRSAIALLLRHNCIPSPHSIYSGISKLMPGHYLTLQPCSAEKTMQSAPYWSVNDAAHMGLATQFQGTDTEAIALLERQLSSSVSDQLISDVPLGAFLSGGIDSSVIVALMQKNSTQSVKTFTIGYSEGSHNEAVHARQVAEHLGTDHTELRVSPDDALKLVPKLPDIYSEPFSNSSQLPTYLICQLTSQHVKVALDGDGGDELFGGYNRYLGGYKVWSQLKTLPLPLRKVISVFLQSVPTHRWDSAYKLVNSFIHRSQGIAWPGDKLHKIADAMRINQGELYYADRLSHWKNANQVVLDAPEAATFLNSRDTWPQANDLRDWMMAMDAKHYIPEDNLVRLDRAAMACSLETRAPLLDHRLVELAWTMPLHMKIRNGTGKWLLREVLYQYVPRELIDRPKMGFAAPIGQWLRNELRDWAEDLLDEAKLRDEGYFDPAPIRGLWEAHLAGHGNKEGYLWDVLMFQAWLRHYCA